MARDTVGFQDGVAWTPDDDDLIPRPPRGFYVEVAGAVALEMENGNQTVIPLCAAGVPHAFWGFRKVLATGTTATGIWVGY